MNLIIELVLGVVCLLSVTIPVAAVSNPYYAFGFDLDTKGVKHETTGDTVVFRLMDGDREMSQIHLAGIKKTNWYKQATGLSSGISYMGGWLSLGFYDLDYSGFATAVEVHIEGNDAMMFDQNYIKEMGSRARQHISNREDNSKVWFGRNNGSGFCLSEDPNDINGKWSDYAQACVSGLSFNIDGTVTSAEKNHRSYRALDQVCIDLDTKGIKNEDTGNSVEFQFWKDDVLLPTVDIVQGVRGSKWWCYDFSSTNGEATALQVTATGSDALFIDKIQLARYGNAKNAKIWGADNGKGWCLSTDPNDINGAWRDRAGACHRCIKFKDDGTASPCR